MKKAGSTKSLRKLLKHVKHIRRQIVLASICSVMNKIFDLAPPVLIGITIDLVVSKENSFIAGFGVRNLTSQLIVISCLTVFIWGMESLFQYACNVLWRNIAQTFQHNLRMEAYTHVQNLDISYFEGSRVGNLANIINNDINQLEGFLNDNLHQIVQLVTTFVFIGGFFFFTVHNVAWLIIIPMPFIVIVTNKYRKIIAPKYTKVREDTAMLNSQLMNNFEGISTIKSFATEKYEEERIRNLSDNYLKSNRRAIKFNSALEPIVRMVIVLGYVMILIICGKLALSGILNIGIFSSLVYLIERLLWPLVGVGYLFDSYQRALACVKRVLELFEYKSNIEDGETEIEPDTSIGNIDFQNVVFNYNTSSKVLNNISLNIQKGETIGVVGSTGSGKSTLLKLLLRFYNLQEGSILLDGIDIRKYRLNDLRTVMAYVSQDIFIFHGTIKANIAYGNPLKSEDEIIEAAKIAEAHDFILQLPNGYDTLIGEKGQTLSGGQRQRLSIARAVLKNSAIILLDEATSALDNETEAAIQVSLEKICQNRTSFIVAHRLSTIRNADRIIVMEDGEIREMGTHEELLAIDGIYARQWCIQTGEYLKHLPEQMCG